MSETGREFYWSPRGLNPSNTMQSFFEWFQSEELNTLKPWLILGKGPSFSKRSRFDLGYYRTISLNHAVREQPVDVAHMIDFDVVDACGEDILRNARVLVLPWFPHRRNRPGEENLAELVHRHPTLRRLDQENRLLWYHLSTAGRPEADSPVIGVRFFSAEAVLNLLAVAGVRTIRSLGVDGGNDYSAEFEDLKNKTLLVNNRKTFNEQFAEIAGIIMRTGIDYAPLDVDAPIRVYVGCTETEALPLRVLEYSVRKHASMSVEVHPLYLSGIEIPLPKDPRDHPRTPFSFQRFLIPALAENRGKAIYLDSDLLAFKDIRMLWTMPFDGADILAVEAPGRGPIPPQFAVMLLNCGSLDWDIGRIVSGLDEGRWTYEQVFQQMAVAENIRFTIPPGWNEVKHFSERHTALFHFTDMSTQPWISQEHPRGYLWMRTLFEAIDAGLISADFVKEQVARGAVRPSLLFQLESRIDDSLLLSRRDQKRDENFVAPYRRISQNRRPSRLPGDRFRAVIRHYYHNSPLFHVQRKLADWLLPKLS